MHEICVQNRHPFCKASGGLKSDDFGTLRAAFWRYFRSKIGLDNPSWTQKCQDDLKMGQHDPQDEAKQAQDVPKMAQLAPKLPNMAQLGPQDRFSGPRGTPPRVGHGGNRDPHNRGVLATWGSPGAKSCAQAQGFDEKSRFLTHPSWHPPTLIHD